MGTLVSFRGVAKSFGGTCALVDLTLSVAQGEFFSILGPSGCGKTTLLRLLSGLETPDAGEIELAGEIVSGPGYASAPERRGVGMVFQSLALWPHLSVLENVEFPLSKENRHKAREMLERLGLEAVLDHPPGRISGGEQQRVALARAVVASPRILLLDEPFTGLDPLLRLELGGLVKKLNRSLGLTVLHVTHLQEEAMSLADRMAVLKDGRIQQIGTPEELYDRPANLFVAAFVGNSNILARKSGGVIAFRPESLRADPGGTIRGEIGRASCRERV